MVTFLLPAWFLQAQESCSCTKLNGGIEAGFYPSLSRRFKPFVTQEPLSQVPGQHKFMRSQWRKTPGKTEENLWNRYWPESCWV